MIEFSIAFTDNGILINGGKSLLFIFAPAYQLVIEINLIKRKDIKNKIIMEAANINELSKI
jgi:hypothetical protein